jgi:hypothetical protein
MFIEKCLQEGEAVHFWKGEANHQGGWSETTAQCLQCLVGREEGMHLVTAVQEF